MPLKSIGKYTIFALLIFPISCLQASPGGYMPMGPLIELSDLIVVAKATEGLQTGQTLTLTLEVKRVLKGQPREQLLRVEVADVPNTASMGAKAYLAGLEGIWFLGSTPDGKFIVRPVMTGFGPLGHKILPATPTLLPQWATVSLDPSERIFAEVAASIEIGQSFPANLAADILSKIELKPFERATSMYRKLLATDSQPLRNAGKAGLLRIGDSTILPVLADEIARSNASTAAWELALCDYASADPAGLRPLFDAAINTAASTPLRQCAAYALRNIHTVETLAYLVALLRSDQSQIRYEAVAGLASYVNRGHLPRESQLTLAGKPQPRPSNPLPDPQAAEHFPAIPEFMRNEKRYLDYWQAWAKQNNW